MFKHSNRLKLNSRFGRIRLESQQDIQQSMRIIPRLDIVGDITRDMSDVSNDEIVRVHESPISRFNKISLT